MTRMRLTAGFVKDAKCLPGRRKSDFFDASCKGLLVEVRQSGGKTYYLRYRNARGVVRQLRLADAADISLTQARQLADRARNQIAMGEDPAEAKKAHRDVPTFAEFVEKDYLPYIRTYKRSWKSDVSLLYNHLLPFLGERYLDMITPREVQRIVNSRRQMGKAPGTCDRMIILARYIFNLALKWKVPGVKENPAKDVDLLKVDNRRERFLNDDEVRRLFEALPASGHPMLPYILPMLLLTGARKREVLDARWEDLDYDNRLWRIPVTKAGRPRTVPMSDGMMAILGSVPRVDGSSYVFPNPDTGLPYVATHKAWDAIRKEAGLSDVRLHDLRHSFASILVNSGRSLYEVQHLLGHTQIKTTERYAHLQQQTLMNAANLVTRVVGGALEQKRLLPR